MTYKELIDKLLAMFGNERGIVVGSPVGMIYDLSKDAVKYGVDNEVDEIAFHVLLQSYDLYDEYMEKCGEK